MKQRGFIQASIAQAVVGGALVLAVGGYITYCQWAKNDRDQIITRIEEASKKRVKELNAELAEQKRINQEQTDEYKTERARLTAGYDSYIEQLRDHDRQSAIANALPAGTGVDEGVVCFDRAELTKQMAGFERRAEERLVAILAEGDHARLVAQRCLKWQRDQRKASELIRHD